MLLDTSKFNSSQTIETDVCIVGAGAAGISIARHFISKRYKVCLMESGAFEIDSTTQGLYKGTTEFGNGLINKPSSIRSTYLDHTRLRFFGGTTNHWAGFCRPMDESDFLKRDWVPNSGWPITREILHHYYNDAAKVVQIRPFDLSEQEKSALPGNVHEILNSNNIFTTFYRFSPPTRFGILYHDELINAPNIGVYINSNALHIQLAENGKKVTQIFCSSLSGNKLFVNSKYYILATGAIENARLLLLSDDIHRSGIGNLHDNVGRYFMEHAEYNKPGDFMVYEPSDLFNWQNAREKDGKRFLPVLCPTFNAQKTHGMLNASIQLMRYSDNEINDQFKEYYRLFSTFDSLRGTPPLAINKVSAYWLFIRSEIDPQPGNRVYLEHDTDFLGLRKVRLSYSLGKLNLFTVNKLLTLLGSELTKLSKGRAEIFFNPENAENYFLHAAHHMGTTRMSLEPREGVVDSDCKVHGISNLYMAGSSVFPTSGYANPTLTIVALSLRLGDHLLDRLNKDE